MESPDEGIRITINVHSTELCVVLFSRRLSFPKAESSEALLSTSMPKGIRPRTVLPVVSRYTERATRPTHSI